MANLQDVRSALESIDFYIAAEWCRNDIVIARLREGYDEFKLDVQEEIELEDYLCFMLDTEWHIRSESEV